MTIEAVEALRNEVGAVVTFCERFATRTWSDPSRAASWSTKDVIIHLAALFQQLADPCGVPVDPALGEHSVDLAVESRRLLLPHEVLEAYVSQSEAALAILASMQHPTVADEVVDMSVLGSHPRHLLANAYAFDHHCHVRHDLGLDSSAEWPAGSDPEALTRAAVDWMMAAAPQMCDHLFRQLDGTVELAVGGTTWLVTCRLHSAATIERVAPGERPTPDTRPSAVARIETRADHFTLWGTQRVPAYRLDVATSGDARLARRILHGLRIF